MVKESRLEEITSLIIEAQSFAEEFLGINYPKPLSITYNKEDILYELYASQKLELGFDYFEISKYESSNKKKVYEEAKKYKQKGYDTFISEFSAYESDGIFLTPKILKDADVEMVDTVVHELLHTQLNIDISIEEAITSVTGSLATISFYEQKEGKLSQNYEKAVREDNKLKTNDNIIIQYYNLLNNIYQQDIPDKEKLNVKKRLCKEAESKIMYNCKINNASLTYHMTYSRYTDEIREVCKYSNSLKDAVKLFKSLPDKSLPDSRAWAYGLIQEFISANKE